MAVAQQPAIRDRAVDPERLRARERPELEPAADAEDVLVGVADGAAQLLVAAPARLEVQRPRLALHELEVHLHLVVVDPLDIGVERAEQAGPVEVLARAVDERLDQDVAFLELDEAAHEPLLRALVAANRQLAHPHDGPGLHVHPDGHERPLAVDLVAGFDLRVLAALVVELATHPRGRLDGQARMERLADDVERYFLDAVHLHGDDDVAAALAHGDRDLGQRLLRVPGDFGGIDADIEVAVQQVVPLDLRRRGRYLRQQEHRRAGPEEPAAREREVQAEAILVLPLHAREADLTQERARPLLDREADDIRFQLEPDGPVREALLQQRPLHRPRGVGRVGLPAVVGQRLQLAPRRVLQARGPHRLRPDDLDAQRRPQRLHGLAGRRRRRLVRRAARRHAQQNGNAESHLKVSLHTMLAL